MLGWALVTFAEGMKTRLRRNLPSNYARGESAGTYKLNLIWLLHDQLQSVLVFSSGVGTVYVCVFVCVGGGSRGNAPLFLKVRVGHGSPTFEQSIFFFACWLVYWEMGRPTSTFAHRWDFCHNPPPTHTHTNTYPIISFSARCQRTVLGKKKIFICFFFFACRQVAGKMSPARCWDDFFFKTPPPPKKKMCQREVGDVPCLLLGLFARTPPPPKKCVKVTPPPCQLVNAVRQRK